MTETLTLKKGEGKSSPKGKNASKLKKALEAAKTVIKEAEYPPQLKDMRGMNYSGKDMASAFPNRILKHADFTDADLSGANLSGFNLQGAIFKNTNVTDTVFHNADLRWSIWKNMDTAADADWFDDEGNGMPDLREVDGLRL